MKATCVCTCPLVTMCIYIYLYIYIYVYHTLFSHNNPSNKAFSHDNYWWKCSLMNMWRISWQFFINITMQDTMITQQHLQIFATLHTHHYPAPEKNKNAKNDFFSHNFVHGVHDSNLMMAFTQNKSTIIFCMTPRFAYNSALGDMTGHPDMLLRANKRVGL